MSKKDGSQEVYELALEHLRVLASGGLAAGRSSYYVIMGDEPQKGDAAFQTRDDLVWAAQVILASLTGSKDRPLKIPLKTTCLIVNVAVRMLLDADESPLLLEQAIQRFVGQFQDLEIDPLKECTTDDPGVYIVWCDLIVHERSSSVRADRDLVSFRPRPEDLGPASQRRVNPRVRAVAPTEKAANE